MAAIIRGCQKGSFLQKCIWTQLHKNSRAISTSKKNSETIATTCDPKAQEAQEAQSKNWVSYGFDYTSQEADTSAHNASFFFSVSLCMVAGGLFWGYSPDIHMRDWASREAFLELRRREEQGLPRISPNFIDPSLIQLPSDEDLAEADIII